MKRRKSYRRMRSYPRRAFRKAKSLTLPIAPIAGFAYALAPPIQNFVSGNIPAGIESLVWRFTGMNGQTRQFDLNGLKEGILPIAAGFAVHWVASKVGINRALARSGVPILRV